MKITPINTLYTQPKFHKVQRTNKPSFMGYNNFTPKMQGLINDSKKLYNFNTRYSLNDITNIIKKYSPTTEIRDILTIPSSSNISPRTGAYYADVKQLLLNQNKILSQNKTMYIKTSSNNPINNLEILSSFVHESTHIFQEESSDRLSTTDFIQRFLVQSKSNTEKLDSIKSAPKFFATIEYNILLPLIKGLQKNNEMPTKIPAFNEQMLDKYFIDNTNLPAKEYVNRVTKYFLSLFRQQAPFMNTDFVLKYAIKKAGQEKEAYQQSLNFLKQVLNIEGKTDLDYRILLYEIFEKSLQEISKSLV